MKINKWIRLIPYIIVVVTMCFEWVEILCTETTAGTKHYIALIATIANGFFYLLRFKIGILLTGILLIAAMFNILSFTAVISTHSYFVKFGDAELTLPAIQLYPLLILILYLLVDYQFLKREFINTKKR